MNTKDLGLQDANTREHSNETGRAYVEKSTDSANYANPLYVVHYPDGTKYSTMQEARARETADNFNRSEH